MGIGWDSKFALQQYLNQMSEEALQAKEMGQRMDFTGVVHGNGYTL